MSTTTQGYLTVVTDLTPEGVTATITGTIKDTSTPPVAIPAASLATVTLTLYNKSSGTVLNGRSETNIKNANDGTVDSNGLLALTLTPADNALEAQSGSKETHVAQITWTYNGGASTGRALVEFPVANLRKVP